MDELLALARDCTVTISHEGGSDVFRFEARNQIDDKEYGIAFLVAAEDVADAKICIVSRRLKEMRHAMKAGMGMGDAA